ncbi:thiamine phosphate synthase [Sphingomonas turrisvirgatae]|uniref:Thiamine phosphate synthase n=1 Tax=Sphingomonas turrisvirgatae TaxID=1888892 RepID=A0A1E3LQD8_9SPHN|nr:thiamine phosphate synthase [Sphingomonas turrisvirgatae]ODP35979.1 thiamine phosphate synthase [Sphingomonas turrisvirgatae]
MRPRHPHRLPFRWLMTDERMGEALWPALARLPRGSGVIVRHYSLAPDDRRALAIRIERIARRRGLVMLVGGVDHGRHRGALTAPVHSRREAIAAIRGGAMLLFASPVHPTRSHPGLSALGRVRLGLMTRGLDTPVIALGGMDERRWRTLKPMRVYGWAAIDAWLTATGRAD